ncbi:MAG TPA: molybdenum cofactor biosynthesis protein MoaE [Longimicrobiaceae bacterium]|nr:molybdenum cofactor biosynthesis protein MoaE [Longimicrobiaceae bacterium]
MSDLCYVTRDPIDGAALLAGCVSASDGAALLFLGVVRDHNDGRPVGHLDYDAYAVMAERVLGEIVAEASSRWRVGRMAVVHRIGRLGVGEPSVAIAVASPHRAEAYEASRYVIEELKKRAPIWKREGYVDGEERWLGEETPGAR